MKKRFNTCSSLLIPTLFLALSGTLSAVNQPFQEKADRELYQKGHRYQREEKFQEAVQCFKPLAEKGYGSASHCVAFCFQALGDDQKAYHWYKNAKAQGYKPLTRELGKLNLLFALLPNEMITRIASFLPLKDLSSFARTSQRAHQIFQNMISTTNFLNSNASYALDVRTIFEEVEVTPKPQAIRIQFLQEVKNGSIEVHFRDPEHLRAVVEQTPLIEADDKVYFVRDAAVKDHQELKPTSGELQRKAFIHIISQSPIKMSGTLNLPMTMQLPPQSDINSCTLKNTRKGVGYRYDKLKAYEDAHVLAVAIETFDEQRFHSKTQEAYQLFNTRKKERQQHPECFPDLLKLCPNRCFLPADNLKISQTDLLYVKGERLIYISPSSKLLEKLHEELPTFSSSINYIDSALKQGVYCSGPLSLMKGFKLLLSGDWVNIGVLELPGYDLQIETPDSICNLGTIKAKNIQINGKNLYNGTNKTKPEWMSESLWQSVLITQRAWAKNPAGNAGL